VIGVQVFLPHGDEKALPEVLLGPRKAEDPALEPEEGVYPVVPPKEVLFGAPLEGVKSRVRAPATRR
jgi:hypothetical protein